ncbi:MULTISPECIES: DUF1292 domain-containing protein [Clostridiaceae]|uniref:DUF1292 domain-containing protein n=1 Tax=Clostridium facile TaxID=2763035 RepID=A0ABR7IRT6_9CLOT|nr:MULTISPECIES: DUF1292 domain-containing protein [Clostridiaceae]MBC5787862.1 DUF1292 domain-containing protein [Clostridium facile]PWM98613.1 MAG: DUF1292 domain-containing protein [Massilioclostridium sp.]
MEQQEYTPDIYTLEDEEGNEVVFEMIDSIELDGQKYYAMMPYYENPEDMLNDDGQLIVLRNEVVDGEEMMATIDDDEEYDRIGEIFMKRITEMFEDDEEE